MPLQEYRQIMTDSKDWYCSECIAPCKICIDPVYNGQRAIQCDKCQEWTHAHCGEVSGEEYEMFQQQQDTKWLCLACCDANFSFSDLDDTASSTDTTETLDRESGKKKTVNRNKLKLIVINFQSMSNKKAELEAIIDQSRPDLIASTETWLDPSMPDSEITPEGFQVHRKDRKNETYGGVLLLYREDLNITRREDLEGKGEILWCQLDITNRRPLLIGTVYKRKHSDIQTVENLDKSLQKINERAKLTDIILTGDYNQPNINWDEMNVIPNHPYSKATAEKLIAVIQENGLEQRVDKPTRGDNILDLVMTNNISVIDEVLVESGLSDHARVDVQLNLTVARKGVHQRTVLQRNKADVEKIRSELTAFRTKYEENSGASVQDKWDLLEGELKRLMKQHIPTKKSRNRRQLPWFDRSLRRLTRKKQRLYNKAKASRRDNDWEKYRDCCHQTRRALNRARQEFITNKLKNDMTDDPKAFWTFVNKLKKDAVGIGDLKDNNKIITDEQDKAELLNKQFTGVFTKEDKTNIPKLEGDPMPNISHLNITENGVLKQLQKLKVNKAPGPDGLFPWFLKMVAVELTPMLTDVFQSSIDEGYVPSQWREANVCGIYKKGPKTEPSNYRPVSLTSVICKVLEHIVHSHIMDHLEQHKILVDNQHGFRSKHSTETQLILTTNDIAKSLEEGETVHMAILDFAKAFDKVPHERLLGKLDHYGIRGPIHRWIRHFLTDRTQKVVCNGAESQPKRVTSSVPQGTVTGPLQFLIYINDLPSKLYNKARLFANDCVVYASGKTTAELSTLQADLKTLEEWQNTWAMEFNASKCYIMKFTNNKHPPDIDYKFCNQQLKEVPTNPYLGIEFDNQLDWGTHIDKTVSKANRVLGVLKRNIWFCTREVKETA